MAQIEYSRGDYAAVISRAKNLLDMDHSEPELLPEMRRIIGLSYFKTGKEPMARRNLEEYFRLIGTDPASENSDANPDAVYALACLDYADGDISRASSLFSTLTDRQDRIGQSAWLYLGQCALRQDNPSTAAISFEKPQNSTPTQPCRKQLYIITPPPSQEAPQCPSPARPICSNDS